MKTQEVRKQAVLVQYKKACKNRSQISKQADILNKKLDCSQKDVDELLIKALQESGILARFTWSISSGKDSYYLTAKERLYTEPELCAFLGGNDEALGCPGKDLMESEVREAYGHYQFVIWQKKLPDKDRRYYSHPYAEAELRFDDGDISLTFNKMTNEEMTTLMDHWGVKNFEPESLLFELGEKRREVKNLEDLTIWISGKFPKS